MAHGSSFVVCRLSFVVADRPPPGDEFPESIITTESSALVKLDAPTLETIARAAADGSNSDFKKQGGFALNWILRASVRSNHLNDVSKRITEPATFLA